MIVDRWHRAPVPARRLRFHPTQEPLPLSRRLIEHFSNLGDLVLVPFVGSDSECVAAVEAGHRFMGAEINPRYVEIAQSRINDATLDLLQNLSARSSRLRSPSSF